MKNLILFFLLFTMTTYATAATPRLDAVENNNAKLADELLKAQKSLMQQELNNKNLESKINELQNELKKLKDAKDNYHIEKITYDSKMQANTNLVNAQDKRISDINFYFVLWGVLITIVLLIVFFKAKQESKETAKETAQEFIEQWIDNRATPHLNDKITEVLQTKDDEINNLIDKQIKNRIKPELSRVKALVKDIEQHRDKAKKEYEETSKYFQNIENMIKDISNEEIEKIEAKDTASLTAMEHYKLGVNAIKDNKFNTALNEIENAIIQSGDSSSELDNFYLSKGFVLDKLGEYDNAIEAYKKAVDINPKKDEAYSGMGIVYGKKGEYEKAIYSFKKAIELNTKNDKAYYNMGIAYDSKKEYDNAIDAYQKAIEINPEYNMAYYNMGFVYDEKDEYDNAIEAYQKAIEINPEYDIAYNGMGVIYHNKKEYDNAIDAYQKAIEINPENDIAYYNMGNVYFMIGEFFESINSYIKHLHINPNNSSDYTNLFELQLTQNQPFDQALEKKYIELFQNEKESFIQYEMLKIFQNITHKKEVNLEQWKQKFKGVSMVGWSFDELEAWIDGIEDNDLKARLQEALDVFKGHG